MPLLTTWLKPRPFETDLLFWKRKVPRLGLSLACSTRPHSGWQTKADAAKSWLWTVKLWV